MERVSAAHTFRQGLIFSFFNVLPMNIQRSNNPMTDSEYIILENIYDSGGQQSPLRQRDLAHVAGTSLGMTNTILKRLAQKGWITIKKLNSRNFQYAVTLDGINEIIHRSYGYFKRTIKNVVFFKKILEDLVYSAKQRKINKVILVGISDLDFIVEHACHRWGLSFLRESENQKHIGAPPKDTLTIYAESITETKKKAESTENTFFLSSLIIRQAAVLT